MYFALDYINYLMLFAHVTMAAGVLIFIGMNLKALNLEDDISKDSSELSLSYYIFFCFFKPR